MYLINQESYSQTLQPDGHFYLEEPKQLGVETKLVVEKQGKKVGFTLQASKKDGWTPDEMIRFNQKQEAQIIRKV